MLCQQSLEKKKKLVIKLFRKQESSNLTTSLYGQNNYPWSSKIAASLLQDYDTLAICFIGKTVARLVSTLAAMLLGTTNLSQACFSVTIEARLLKDYCNLFLQASKTPVLQSCSNLLGKLHLNAIFLITYFIPN